MKRTLSAVVTVLLFLAAIFAWSSYQAHGNPFTYPGFAWMLEHNRPVSVTFAALSLGYIALAAWIAAALARGAARRTVMLGWLAALPTLVGVLDVVMDVTGFWEMIVGDPMQDPDAYHRLPARLVNFTRGTTMLLGFSLPFSAGVIIFGLVYPIIMIARGCGRLLRGRPPHGDVPV